jgi:glycine/D-amino acid oxidase-like deaminating enzyme
VSRLGESEIVIVGAGAVGLGVAYGLARAGKTDVLLLEREQDVGQVTSAQGAGLCGRCLGGCRLNGSRLSRCAAIRWRRTAHHRQG